MKFPIKSKFATLIVIAIATSFFSQNILAAKPRKSDAEPSTKNAKSEPAILRISCTDSNEGALVSINGKVKGECPFDTKVPAGTVTVSAKKTSADGAFEQVFEKELVMGEGIVKKVEIELGSPVMTEVGKQIELDRLANIEIYIAKNMVTIPGGGYEMGKYEVTQEQWMAIMGNNPSAFKNCGGNCPVENVSWDDVQEFIKKLNAKSGKQYRLPSDYEWERACRAGYNQQYCGSNNIDAVAWFSDYETQNGKRESMPHPVGQKQANAWGLYDMSGNVYEMTSGCINDHNGDCVLHVTRGGSWYNERHTATTSYRVPLNNRTYQDGFRLTRTLP